MIPAKRAAWIRFDIHGGNEAPKNIKYQIVGKASVRNLIIHQTGGELLQDEAREHE